ncbi:MAG: BolA family transcriptional regulator [Gammaproteobacteria bacterium]|nr:BolA family transcriptional regulator [Gammaproteobacteria bacterium]
MPPSNRELRLRERLESAFAPVELRIVDESAQHAGHAGAAGGLGHFRVVIVAAAFAGLAPIARHRRVYAALGEMMQTDIHALTLDARAPE